MAQDVIKPKGPTRRSSPTGYGSNPQLVPLFGVVKDNIDPNREGRIFVYLADNSGLDPNDSTNWRRVKFLSPFYGFTKGDAATDTFGNFKNNPSSYGMWMSPPDIGTTVLCLFVNGDLNYGFYIGCVPEPESLQMVPAIGAVDNIVPNKGEAASYGGALKLPVTNINRNNKAIADTSDYLKAAKPIHSYVSSVMFQQGILRDPIRGPISSSSQRETPSRVGWGVSTPGRPIYEGGFDDKTLAQNLDKSKEKQLRVISRRGGHSIVMDDGDIVGRDNLIRIRTSLGHQILMSDDGQTLMILHSNGQSYVELGKEGTVDIYATNSINLRTHGDLNLHADRDVNIHATRNLNLQGENIHLTSEKEYKQRVGSNYSNFTVGKHTTKVNGPMSMESSGDISMASSAQAFVNGSKVLLNSGQTSTKPTEVAAITKTKHPDTLFDKTTGFSCAPGKLTSITSRAPAHTPWTNAGQGIDVKIDLSSAGQLPSSPSSAAAGTNAGAAAAGVKNPVAVSTAAAAPVTGPASEALGVNASKGLAAQVSTNAANGPLADALTKGTAIATTAAGVQVGIGQFAQNPLQLERAGVLKPGAAALATSLAASTGNLASSLTNNLFTGKPGASNLPSFLQSIPAQTDSLIKNLQIAQVGLQNSGLISGLEAPSQLGGLVMSAAQYGVPSTLGAAESFNFGFGGPASFNITPDGISNSFEGFGDVDGVYSDISAGNFAAGLGEFGGGALNGLQTSVQSLIKSPDIQTAVDQTAGLEATAYKAIAASFKPLQAGVPNNLTALAKKAAEDVASSSVSSATNSLNQAASSLSSLARTAGPTIPGSFGTPINNTIISSITVGGVSSGSKLPKLGSVADSLVNASASRLPSQVSDLSSSLLPQSSAFASSEALLRNPNSAIASLQGSATSLASGLLTTAASSIASGVNNLPGAQNAIGKLTNMRTPSVNLPGTENFSASLTNKATELLNNVGNIDISGLNELPSGDLLSTISKNLPAGLAAELQNAMGSVAAAGSGIKMPSVAVNTTDRSSINAAVVSQLDDPGIPAPTFGEVDEQSLNAVKAVEQSGEQIKNDLLKLAQEVTTLRRKRDTAEKNLDKLRKKLPQGDPGIDSALQAFNSAFAEVSNKQDEFDKLYRKSKYNIA